MTTIQQTKLLQKLDMDSGGESSSSELERLEAFEVESGVDSPSENEICRTRKQEELVLLSVRQCKTVGSKTLELTEKGLLKIPDELLELDHIEYLYLEGNELSSLPNEFFDRLPNLVWLDLRRNYLMCLPSVYTGRHQNLRNLLLEGNNLKSLPLELGLVKTLKGLNIRNNPLEFPPPDVIEKGTNEILRFLREMIQAKASGKLTNGAGNGDDSTSSSDDWNCDHGDGELHNYAMYKGALEEARNHSATTKSSADMFGPVPQSAELHRPVSYTEIKQEKVEKLKKAGALGTVDRRKSSSQGSIMTWQVNQFPEPPLPEYVDFKMGEERRLAKVRDLKIKQEAIIQRRKDEQILKDWRDESKRLQQKKYFDSLRKGTTDFLDPVLQAPFGIEKEHLKIPTNEERIKQDVKSAHEKVRKTLSPASRQRIQEEKAARIQELEKRIKHHTSQMHERRRQPKGTPQEEMEAAKRELEVAEELHRQLMERRKELEYRFRAFTADISTGFSNGARV